MSAGQFLDAFYEMDNTSIAAVKIQPETAALVLDGSTNTIPAGPADVPVLAKVSGSRRSYGIHCRTVTVKFTGAVPDGYQPDGQITLPWLQQVSWAALPPKATGTYLASPVTLVFKTAEKVK